MPGTPDEYLASDNTQEAIRILNEGGAAGSSGEEIIQNLEGSGLRVYTPEEMDTEAAPEEAPLEELPPEEGLPLEEPPMEEGPMGESELGPGIEPKSGEDGGMRDMRIDAVRFGLKKAKEESEEEEE